MIYIDSCIPMYLVGGIHSLKERTIELLPGLIYSEEELVTSAETFQEIIHRYKALGDIRKLNAAYSALEDMISSVAEIKKEDVDLSRNMISQYENLSSRDCLHVAVMKRLKCKKIWSYDAAFDRVITLRRIF